jgi:hypothetical protein
MARGTAVATLILVAFVVAPAAANALTTTVTRTGSSLRVEVTNEGNLDNKNGIHVTEDASNTYVEDAGADTDAIVPAGSCFTVSTTKVACPANPSNTTALAVHTGSGDDSVTIDLPVRSASGIATVSVFGGPGRDSIVGSEGPDTLDAEGLNGVGAPINPDELVSITGNRDVLFGRGGADTLRGGVAVDYLNGGSTTTAVDQANTLDGGAGSDFFDVGASLGPDRVMGGPDDGLTAVGVIDLGTEIFTPLGGDTVSYRRRTFATAGTAGVTVDLDASADDGATGLGEGDRIDPDVEALIGTAREDRLVGTSDREFLEGDLGSDTLVGGGADDRLRFREGVRDKCYTVTAGAIIDLDLTDPAPEDCQIRLLPTTTRITKSPRDETMVPPVIGSALRRVSNGLSATLRCDREAPKACSGVMTVQGARGGKRLARARFRVRPGRSGRVLLRLAPERARTLPVARLTTVGRGLSRRGSTTVIGTRRVR